MSGKPTGRTWFSRGTSADFEILEEDAASLKFCLHASSLRSNSQVFADLKDEDAGAQTQKALLRKWLFIVDALWDDSSRGRVTWDALGNTTLWFVRDSDLEEDANAALSTAISLDAKLLGRPQARSRWSTSDLIVDRYQWRAPTVGKTRAPDQSHEFAGCLPAHVFGVLQREEVGGVPLLKVHLQECVFWEKFLPHFQEQQFPDYPLFCDDPVHVPRLMRSSAVVPEPRGLCTESEWELFLQRTHEMERTLQRQEYRAWCLRQLQCTLDGKLSGFIPRNERSLNEWPNESLPPIPWVNGNLSSFACWVTHVMTNLEMFGFVYSAHLTTLKMWAGCLDVYYEKPSGSLHYCCLLAGPPAASKSFCLTLVEKMLVPGTCSLATRRTANSKSYDQDDGAGIDIDHEVSKAFFGAASFRNNADPKTAQMKEIMTSHCFRTESLWINEEGRRIKKECKSRCHRAVLGATNDLANGGANSNDEALLSRFELAFPSLGSKVKGKDLVSLMTREKDPTEADRAGMAAFVRRTRAMQKRAYWVMRAISVRAIDDVDFTVMKYVLAQFCNHCKQGAPKARTQERIFMLARVLTILTALVEEYDFKTSPRADEVPELKHLAELQPRLKVTVEIAKFSIELFRAEFEVRHETIVLDVLRKCGKDLVSLENNPAYVHPKQCSSLPALTKFVVNVAPTEAGVTREIVSQCLQKLGSKRLERAPDYRPALLHEDPKFANIVRDDTAPRKTCCAAVDFAVHAHVLEQCSTSNVSVDESLQMCVQTEFTDEITATPVSGIPHRLRLRRMQARKHSNHTVNSGLYMSPADLAVLDVQVDKTDVERSYTHVVVDEHIEPKMKRPRLSRPHTANAVYGAENHVGAFVRLSEVS